MTKRPHDLDIILIGFRAIVSHLPKQEIWNLKCAFKFNVIEEELSIPQTQFYANSGLQLAMSCEPNLEGEHHKELIILYNISE